MSHASLNVTTMTLYTSQQMHEAVVFLVLQYLSDLKRTLHFGGIFIAGVLLMYFGCLRRIRVNFWWSYKHIYVHSCGRLFFARNFVWNLFEHSTITTNLSFWSYIHLQTSDNEHTLISLSNAFGSWGLHLMAENFKPLTYLMTVSFSFSRSCHIYEYMHVIDINRCKS